MQVFVSRHCKQVLRRTASRGSHLIKEQVNQQRERAFPRDTKVKETLNLACDYFTYVGVRSFMRKFSCKMSQNKEIHRATIARLANFNNQTKRPNRPIRYAMIACLRRFIQKVLLDGVAGGGAAGEPGGPLSMYLERKSCPCPMFLLRWR